MHSHPARSRALLLLVTVATIAIAAACGGSSGGASAPNGGAPAGDPGANSGASGEYADEAVLRGSVAKLADLESFSYETKVGVENLGEDLLLSITGVERPADGDRAFYATRNDGVEWSAMTVDGAFYADIGRGLEPLDAREDGDSATDPNWVANLLDGVLERHWDAFVVVAEESISDRPVIHYRLEDDAVDKILNSQNETGFETFSVELWVDKADGYLVRANLARLPFPTSGFTWLREFRFELDDVGCACPITKPS
jgi:hypothetical protein